MNLDTNDVHQGDRARSSTSHFSSQTTTYDGGPAKEKRQISLASGDYPDLYMLIPWVDAVHRRPSC